LIRFTPTGHSSYQTTPTSLIKYEIPKKTDSRKKKSVILSALTTDASGGLKQAPSRTSKLVIASEKLGREAYLAKAEIPVRI
jgi:hypothetical protein